MSEVDLFGRTKAALRSLMQNSTFRGVALIGSGTAIGQAITVVATPIVSRLYGPQAYGALGVFSSVLVIGAILVSFRFEVTIPLPSEEGEARDLLVLSTVLTVLFVGLTCLGLVGWRLLAKPTALSPLSSQLVWTVPLGMLGIGCYQIMSYWATRKKLYRPISVTRLNQAIAAVCTQIALFRLSPQGLGLMLAAIVGQAFGIRPLFSAFWKTSPHGPLPTIPRLVSLGRKYWSLSASGTATALAQAVGDNLPSLLLAKAFGLEIAGLYLMAARLCNLPAQMIGAAVSQVFMGEASQRLRDDPRSVPRYFQTVHNKLLWLGAATLVLGLLSPLVLPWVLGPKWYAAGAVAAILAPMAAMDITVRPLFNITVIGNRPRMQFYTGLLPMVFSIAGLGVPILVGLSSRIAIMSYAGCRCLSYWIIYRLYLGVAKQIGAGSAPGAGLGKTPTPS